MGYQNHSTSPLVTVLPAKEYLPKTNVDGDIPSSEIASITTFSSSQSEGLELAQPILVYGGTPKIITARDIINAVNDKVADSFARCYISERAYLTLFQDSLAEMLLLNGDKRYNNFIAEYNIKLQSGQIKYELPKNIDKIICLWAENDVGWGGYGGYTTKKKFDFVPRTSWSQNNRLYTFSVIGNQVLIKTPVDREIDSCNHCQTCSSCKLVKGTLRLEYYFLPDLPTSLDEPLWWFWNHLSATQYLQEILLEAIYMLNKQSYQSPTKVAYRNKLIEYDNNLNPIDSSPKINKQTFRFSKH